MSAVGLGETANGRADGRGRSRGGADSVAARYAASMAGCGSGSRRCIVAITPSTATATETITAAWKPSSSTCLKVLLRSGLPVEREQGTRKFVRLRREELDARFPSLLASVLQA
jgi:hypothetical protein